MKKIILFLPLVFASLLLNAQDLKNYIPETATFIVKINGARINNNVNFEEIRATEMYKDVLFKIMNNKTAEERAITTLFETPDETGLNIKADMYYYDVPDNTVKKAKAPKKKKKDYEYDEYDYELDHHDVSTPMYVVAIPLLNSKKFASFISDLFYRNQKAKIVKAGKGINYIQNNSVLIVWSTDKVFFCMLPYHGYSSNGYSKGHIKNVIKLVTTPLPSKSVLTNTRILNGLGVDADIAYSFNSNAWSKNPWLFDDINRSDAIKDSTVFNEDLFKDNYSFSYVNFENGRITFTGNQFYGKKIASIFNPIFNLKPSAKLAGIVYQTPVTSYISYAFSLTEVQKFVDKTFKYNMDTLLIEVLKDQQDNVFETDSQIRSYRKEIDTIDYMVNGPDEEEENYYGEEQSTITDSGTVYQDAEGGEFGSSTHGYGYNESEAKYEHETLNWYQLDSLEQRQDSLYVLIEDRKDTLAVKTYQGLGIKGDELWSIFNGEFIFLYHAMTSVEKKSKVYEMDAEYNYVEVEKTNTIPMPLYSLAATINNETVFNKYLALMVQKGFIQKEKNRYLVVLGDMNQYIWIDKSVCILTNDNNFNPTKHKAASQSVYEIENFKRITAHQSGAYIEVGKILASSVQFVEDKQVAEVLEILAKYFDETIYITDFDENTNVSTKMDILFNDDKKNSINILVQMMDEMYVHFTKK